MEMKLSIIQILNYVILMSAITIGAQGKARITQAPLSNLYVASGGTARFVWNYTVDNRTEEFQLFSPAWKYYYANGTVVDIAQEHFLNNWKWKISNDTCPHRLLYPTTRVSKESIATMVISNVTIADSGIYELVLLLRTARPVKSKVRLIVTTPPKFIGHFRSSKEILEGEDLNISCSAVGIPTPNITWVILKNKSKDIISQGIGFAVISIRNITRHQGGAYQCQATNNPNEYPVVKQTEVIIWYKPHITFLNWTVHEKVILLCLATGHPNPLVKWYYQNGTQINSGVTEMNGGRRVAIEIPNHKADLYGRYQCNASNKVGWQVDDVNVSQIERPTTEKLTTHTFTEKHANVATSKTSMKAIASFMSAVTRTSTSSVTFATTPDPTTKGKRGLEKANNKVNITNIVMLCIFGVLLPIVITVSVILLLRRKHCAHKSHKENGTDAEDSNFTHQHNVLPETQNTVTYAEVRSIPLYAQVDKSTKRADQGDDHTAIYAQVDKRKKKRPGQIIYAELEDFKSKAETTCTVLPPPYIATEYADFRNIQNQDSSHVRNTEPVYETFPDHSK